MCIRYVCGEKCFRCRRLINTYVRDFHCEERCMVSVSDDPAVPRRPYCPRGRVTRQEGFLPYCDRCGPPPPRSGKTEAEQKD
ncbi:hypothetical protein CSOJ01_02892 [Colletotrichum sojae]|uniref:Uncharacterized protein n=1 Tax=Colletotrichum sojae TaxID=2175907 RepID=A0A8H6JPM9_9PEZI|nr:hypothetical protein CSOJ01_02892 [Colletotrichum sojae]